MLKAYLSVNGSRSAATGIRMEDVDTAAMVFSFGRHWRVVVVACDGTVTVSNALFTRSAAEAWAADEMERAAVAATYSDRSEAVNSTYGAEPTSESYAID